MSESGDAELLIAARTALLDALDALAEQRDALVLIGAQAIYLHTGAAPVALAESTKDSDLGVDPRALSDVPSLDESMAHAGFRRDLEHPQPGTWFTRDGIPIDLMVPEELAGAGGRRGARIPPHSNNAARRAPGLEAAVIDNAPMTVTALDPRDVRQVTVAVAGPGALLIAKLHKLGERQHARVRLFDKDAHDVYRLLVAVSADQLAAAINRLQGDPLAADATQTAIDHLRELFAVGPDATGARLAGRAEELVGDAEVVSAAATTLAGDLLDSIDAVG